MRELEPLSFDRSLRQAARELERRKASGESLSDALSDTLLDPETLHWLRERRKSDPLAPSLELWLLRLREQAHFGDRRRKLARLHRTEPYAISEPEQCRMALGEMLNASLTRPRERAQYLRSYFASSAELAEQVRRLWEDRQLFAEQIGTPLHCFEVASEATLTVAQGFIEATRGAFETLRSDSPAALVTTLLAESAKEGWPARLNQRSTLDLLGDPAWYHGLSLRAFAVPRALAGSSFLLALAVAGRALSDAASALRSPFSLATDVFDLRRDSLGALLAALPLTHSFAVRRLGIAQGRVRDQQRALARAALADLRVAAYRVLLRELLLGGLSQFQSRLPELSHAALGFELPLEAAGVFIRVRPRDSQRFSGALLAASRHYALEQAHDEDWFRNPRAIAELRAELSEPLPNLPTAESLQAGAGRLSARLLSLL